MSKARMLFTDPEYRRKYVEYGVDYNPFDGGDMYQWTRKIQRYAKYEPSHPLNVGSRQFDVMEPFKGGELSNPYREQIEEFRGDKDDEEKPVVKTEMTTQTQPISDVFGRVITARKYDTSVPTSRTTRTNNGVQDGKVEMKKKMVEAGSVSKLDEQNKKFYPQIKDLLKTRTSIESKKWVNIPLESLKFYANENNVNIIGLTKKKEIIAVLQRRLYPVDYGEGAGMGAERREREIGDFTSRELARESGRRIRDKAKEAVKEIKVGQYDPFTRFR